MDKGKALEISPNEVLAIPDIPPPSHEITTILWFGTSYELVDWLTKHLQFTSYQLAQEHKDREMIQCALLGETEPKDEQVQS